jgi:hypothetical protein
MDNTRPAACQVPKTSVFTDFWEVMADCKAAQDAAPGNAPAARAPHRCAPPLGVLALVHDSQCEPVSEVEISDPPSAAEHP